MSAAAACSGGAAPCFAPGLALPYDNGVAQQIPHGLSTSRFKRACEHSELEVDISQKAKMMATRIFTSSETTYNTLRE
eukprot:9266119-Karenia_brevis.AAC.1